MYELGFPREYFGACAAWAEQVNFAAILVRSRPSRHFASVPALFIIRIHMPRVVTREAHRAIANS